MSNFELVIMAAGMGSRYGGLKQLDAVGPSGETLLDYTIYDALKSGFEKVVFIIRKDIERIFHEKIGKTLEKHIEVTYAFQEIDRLPEGFQVPADRIKPWGTGHAVLCAKDVVSAPFVVINADDYYGRQAYRIIYDQLQKIVSSQNDGLYTMVGYMLENTLTDYGAVSRGVCEVTGEYLQNITERAGVRKRNGQVSFISDDNEERPLPDNSVVSMNFWGFTPSIFTELEVNFEAFLRNNIHLPKAEYFLPYVVNNMIRKGQVRVKVLPTDEKWFGVTYRDDKQQVEEMILRQHENGTYPPKLWD